MADEAQLLQHCAPVFFLPNESAWPGSIENNGTLGLIDTGLRKILVTCCHVWDGFVDFRSATHSARLATVFSNGFHPPVFLDAEPVSLSRDLDLAVFEARPENWDMGYKRFHRPDRWPIPRALAGQPVAFVGFAGEGRQCQGFMGEFQYSFFGLSISAASDRKLMLAQDRSRVLRDNHGNLIPPMRMGGMSGSPAYLRSRTGAFSLAGFVQMGSSSEDDIFLTHASFVKPDGTINL